MHDTWKRDERKSEIGNLRRSIPIIFPPSIICRCLSVRNVIFSSKTRFATTINFLISLVPSLWRPLIDAAYLAELIYSRLNVCNVILRQVFKTDN